MVRVAKVPYGIRISRADGSAEILWRDGSEAELVRVAELLARTGEAARAAEARREKTKEARQNAGGEKGC